MEKASESNRSRDNLFDSFEVGSLSLPSSSQGSHAYPTLAHGAFYVDSMLSSGLYARTHDSSLNANTAQTTASSVAHGSAPNAQPVSPSLPDQGSLAASISKQILSTTNTLLTQQLRCL